MTTKGLRERVRGHHQQAKSKRHQSYFTRAILKYGIAGFEFSIVDACKDQRDALSREVELIRIMKPEYNISPGGNTGPVGFKHTEDTKRQMRESRAGRPGHWGGRKRSPESIAKRTATRALNPVRPWAGKKRSPETIAKISVARKGKPANYMPTPDVLDIWLKNMTSANEKRFRAVYCSTDGKAFMNAQDCANYYGVARSALGRWLRGEAVCQRGLKFEYVE